MPLIPNTDFHAGQLATAEDPYDLLARVRSEGPVLQSQNGLVVSGHRIAEQILRSNQGRSGFIAELYRQILPPGAAREEMSHRINFLDPPDHPRVRRLISKTFTPKRVGAVRPYIAELARQLLTARTSQDGFDLLEEFAHPLPALVISELLGVPPEDRDRLTDLSDRVSRLLGLGALDAAAMEDAVQAAEEMHSYLKSLLAERRTRPQDDLLSAMLQVEDESQRLSESETLSLAATLYSAGHRTTRDLFINGVATLLGQPQLIQELRSGKLSPAATVTEFLRFETPTHYVVRMLAEPISIEGFDLSAGVPITLLLAAANRDPEVYPQAETFIPKRWMDDPQPPQPLSFAFGPHFCLGANLARMEAEEMLIALIEVFPNIRPTKAPLRWRHSGLFRSLERYPVHPNG